MPLTMRQIMASTPSNRRQKANSVKIKAVKIKKLPNGRPMVMAQTSSREDSKGKSKPASTANTYVTSIEVAGKYAIVSCSCADFMYRWEYALNKKKAARIEYSNGEPPDEQNPTLIPGCCAHLYRLGEKMITEGKL